MNKGFVRAVQAAGVALLASSLTGVAVPAHAAAACPTSGGSETKIYAPGGVVAMGKSCFSFGDRVLRANDVNADSISAYARLFYGSNYAQWWDSNGADNGWEASGPVPVGGANPVTLWACAYDQDGSTGIYDYGCSNAINVYRSSPV